MSAGDFAEVVLAAGKGTRLKSNLAKVLHRAGGRPLVEHVVLAARELRPQATYVIVGHQADAVRAVVEPRGARCVLQQPQNGTGHALLVARRYLRGVKYALVVPGDAPLIRAETLRALLEAHRRAAQTVGAAATILSAILHNPTGYGRIVRKHDGSVAAIVEEKALTPEQREIREVNSSIYCFTLEKLWPRLSQVRPENVHREIYLTDAIALLDQQGEKVLAEVAPDPHEILGCNTRAELAEVDRLLRHHKRAALMAAGVTIYLPNTVTIDADVQVGTDTVIEPNVQLLGKTRIGANCVIRSGSVITHSLIEDGCEVRQNCVVSATHLGKGVVVGPMAHLRDGADIRAGARVGNYVEVKKSVLHEGVKAMHLTYLGDASVGKNTNVGAGTITCNYDGVRKNPTKIGAKVFVGSGTELVAPVRVGDGAYIAAGSTITEDVPANALGIARGRQTTKPGWAAARRRQLAAAANPRKKKQPRKSKAPKAKKKAKRR